MCLCHNLRWKSNISDRLPTRSKDSERADLCICATLDADNLSVWRADCKLLIAQPNIYLGLHRLLHVCEVWSFVPRNISCYEYIEETSIVESV